MHNASEGASSAFCVQWPGAASPQPAGVPVFLVDDDQGFRGTIRELLEDSGFTIVGEAGAGAVALKLIGIAARGGPMVVLMDVRMPGALNGIETTRELTAAGAPVRVIVLTAFPEAGIEDAARDAGAVAVLVKGVPAREIEAAVRAAWAVPTGRGSRD